MIFEKNTFSKIENDLVMTEQEKSLLFLIPLIQTAWVCGAVSPLEKQIVFLAARSENIDERSVFNDFIDELLTIQPSKKFFEDCLLKIKHILASITVAERRQITSKIFSNCEKVAASAGGKSLMDINHETSIEETLLISEIKEALA
jgi:hypothetical protein